MDIRSTLPPALAGVGPLAAAPATPAGAADPAAELQGLASVVLDSSGNASDDDKLSAYNTTRRQAVTGQYRSLGLDDRRLLNQIGNSDTAQAVQGARTAYETQMRAAIQQAGASGAPHGQALGAAAVAHFDGLSGHDQKLLLSSLNAPDRTGATPFTGAQDWRDQMAAMGRVSAPVDRVDLSADAQARMAPAQPSATPAAQPYVAGSVANLRV